MTTSPSRLSKTIREALAMILSQPVVSVLTLALIAGMSATVVLTSGRTAAAERDLLAKIDEASSRAVVVRAEPKAGLGYDVVDKLSRVQDVEWVGAFGPARDATNGTTGSDVAVAVRSLVATSLEPLGLPTDTIPLGCYATTQALDLLGMPDASGYLTTGDGEACAVTGRLTSQTFLEPFEPLVVQPTQHPTGTQQADGVALVVILARDPEHVAAVAAVAGQLVAPIDASGITVDASPEIGRLRDLVQEQLQGFGRSLTLTLMTVLAALVGALQFGLVMIRRKDFGRRRALGATRALIVALVSLSTVLIAIAASLIGAGAGLAVLLFQGEPLPGADFVSATLVLTTAAAALGALPPSIAASRRDPLVELRVP